MITIGQKFPSFNLKAVKGGTITKGNEFIDVLKTLHKLGLDSTDPVRVRTVDNRLTMGEPKARRSSRRWRERTLEEAPKKASAA